MHRVIFNLILLLSILLVYCNRETEPLIPPQDSAGPAITQSEFVAITNTFGFELFRRINHTKQDSNIFISPFSVSMVLGMALNGANGNTFEQIRQTMGFDAHELNSINLAYKAAFEQLQNRDAQVVLELANALWYEKAFRVLPSFLEVNRAYFFAEVQKADFADPATLLAINNWVKQKTHGKIESILKSIPRDALLYLLNAIYFKGTWTYAFNADDTKDWIFHTANGSLVHCPMMFLTRRLAHYQGNHFEMVLLPYGKGAFNMAVILPRQPMDLDSLLRTLDRTRWQSWLATAQTDSGTIGLPRFSMQFEMKLNNLLKEMGMSDAFNPATADFSHLTPENGIYISLVKHKTFAEVNEEGTEAAGVTIVGFERNSSDFFEMIADRPFLLLIYEKNSGIILFMGKMANPAED